MTDGVQNHKTSSRALAAVSKAICVLAEAFLLLFLIEAENGKLLLLLYQDSDTLLRFVRHLNPDGWVFVVIVLFCWNCHSQLKHSLCFSSLAYSFLFSVGYLVCEGFRLIGSMYLPFAGAEAMVTSMLLTAALMLLCQYLQLAVRQAANWVASQAWKLPGLWKKHPVLFPWCVLVLCYFPYLLIRYPCGIESDAFEQIQQFLGRSPLRSDFPVASTAFIGLWVWLGEQLFHSVPLGYFLSAAAQTLLCTGLLAASLSSMKKLSIPVPAMYLTLGVYCVSVIYPAYLTSVVKDAPYACLVVYFTALLAEWVFLPQDRWLYIRLAIVGLCVSMARTNGVIIITICLLVALLSMLSNKNTNRREAGKLSLSLGLVICAYSYYIVFLLPAFGAEPASIQEPLSLPFQQTARYVTNHSHDVTPEEIEAIDAVLDYQKLPEVYEPLISDPVKGTFHGGRDDLPAYFLCWFRQFQRHPLTYLSATLHNCYGFFDVTTTNDWFYHASAYWTPDSEAASVRLDDLKQYIRRFYTNPFLYAFYNTGIQLWIALYLLLNGFRGKGRYVYIPVIAGLLMCVASPCFFKNGVRYALPVIYSNPLLLSLFVLHCPTKTETAP